MPEIAILVDYNVVKNYISLIVNPDTRKNAEVLLIIASFFKRLVFQLKQFWIFYQLDFLAALHEYLQEGACNNSLMKGLNGSKPQVTNKRLEMAKQALREVILTIVTKFVET